MISDKSIKGLENGNRILGECPQLIDSEVCFEGSENILFCEPGVTLKGSGLYFKGDHSVIFLGASKYEYKLFVALYHDSVFHMGQHNYINQKMTVLLSEQRHCFIGDYGVFSFHVYIRNSDPHLIYDCSTRARINPTQSVYIGDHVWIGQDALVLKGTKIHSGSIIGGMSVVAGKTIPSNTVWAGNPARQIREGVFWDRSCVHDYREDMTEDALVYDTFIEKHYQEYRKDNWIYKTDSSELTEYERIDDELNSLKNSQGKCDYLLKLNECKTKNRFA